MYTILLTSVLVDEQDPYEISMCVLKSRQAYSNLFNVTSNAGFETFVAYIHHVALYQCWKFEAASSMNEKIVRINCLYRK